MVPKWTLTEGGPKVNIWSEGEYFGPKVYMNRMWIFFGPKVDILYRHLRTTPFGPCLGPKVNMDRRWTWSQGGQFLVRRWAIGPKVDMVRRWWSEGGCSQFKNDFRLLQFGQKNEILSSSNHLRLCKSDLSRRRDWFTFTESEISGEKYF